MATTGGNDTVTNKQLYDELKEMRAELADQFKAKADASVTDDHEERIRSLERFRYAIPSLSLLGVLAAAGETAFLIFHH